MTFNTKKISIAIGVLAALIIISGLAEPIIINSQRDSWENTVNEKVNTIEFSVADFIDTEIIDVVDESKELKNSIGKILNESGTIPDIIEFINSYNYNNTNIQVIENDTNLIAWNKFTFASDYRSISSLYALGEAFFYSDKLVTYLVIEDTLTSDLKIIYSKPIEKHYTFKNNYFVHLSLSEKLSDEFSSQFKINFNPAAQYSLDGRFSSIDIINNFNNKIGVVNFQKPTLTNHLNFIKDVVNSIQSLLFIFIYILLGIIIYLNIKKITSRLIRLIVYSFYITLFRIFILVFNLPHKFISGDLTDPNYFFSKFGFGISSSPIDFFISVLLLLILCLVIYKYSNDFVPSEKLKSRKTQVVLVIVLTFLFMMFLRGFAASINSVVFDSTLRYFRDVSLLPNAPIFLMEINILLLGFCFVLISIAIVQVLLKLKCTINSSEIFGYFIFLFVVFQIAGIFFDLFQEQPQGTPFIRVLSITFIFMLSYYVFLNKAAFINFIFVAFVASIISISLLNFYNSELQRESLKTTALKLVSPSEPFIKNLISETFRTERGEKLALNALESNENNYSAAAFKIWINSEIYNEGISSEINFLDTNKNYLGGYGENFDEYYRADWTNFNLADQTVSIFTESLIFSDSKIIRGISPLISNGKLLGYLEISVLYDVDTFEFRNMPDFLSSKKDIINPEVEYADLSIFDFHDGELINELSDFTLSADEREILTDVKFSELNEAWLTIPLKGEIHRLYLVKNEQPNFERILAVALKERETSWNLYDFFKVFFIHSLIIISILLLFILLSFRRSKSIKLTFRTRLLLAFILVSIVPLILLASYFRILTEEKNSSAILYKLGKRAFSVESYINDYIANSTINSREIFNKANRDLGISYSIFKEEKLIFSSDNKYYEVGIIPKTINPVAYNELINLGAKEFVIDENIENYNFNSFYYRGIIGSEEYIFKVSELFNSIQLPLSDIEINIFLFGSYSLAVLLIVILSTILANQISSPIRKLTNATKSVAGGDLNIALYDGSRGEIGQLVSGFNLMVRQLKKSQAELADIERETAWKEFARQVAHEIKNPLTPMKLSVQQLSAAHKDKSPKFNEIFEKVTQTLINQIETLKNIATEFSSFARMPKMNVEKMNLNTALNNAVNLFTEENVKIIIYNNAANADVVADLDQITRVLINLIRNSIQANASIITFTLLQTENHNELRIEDNGHGIIEELREKVFENNFTTKKDGMGIGLSLAKRYIENINGSIKIEKTSVQGTTLLISFPKVFE